MGQTVATAERLEAAREAARNARIDRYMERAPLMGARAVIRTAEAAELASMAAKHGKAAERAAAEYSAMAEAAEAMGVTAAELTAAIATERALLEAERGSGARQTEEIGEADKVRTVADVVEARRRVAERHNSAAAVAGRRALDVAGMGSALVVTIAGRNARRVGLGRAVNVPASVAAARKQAEAAAERYSAAERVAAERASGLDAALAYGTGAARVAAERKANKAAEKLSKLASKADIAARAVPVAERASGMADQHLQIVDHVATVEAGQAAAYVAAYSEAFPIRMGVMPRGLRDALRIHPDREPSDGVWNALCKQWREAELEAAREAWNAKHAAKQAERAAADTAEAEAKRAATNAAYKAREAARQRARRAAAKRH